MTNALAHTDWLSLAAAGTLAFAVLMYVLLDGTDLGVGVLFVSERNPAHREVMVETILPVWDGNETWIVLGGGGLIAMFPPVYSALLTAMYPVIFAMLFALILRGVAIEFRGEATARAKSRWDAVMQTGSTIAAFCQGVLVGSLVQGIRTVRATYQGGPWDWLGAFTLFCGVALALGYAWLGASWLIWRTEGILQQHARRASLMLGIATAACTATVSVWTLHLNDGYAHRWKDDFGGMALPVAVFVFALLATGFVYAVARRRAFAPLVFALFWFVFALLCVLYTIFPFVLPPSITIAQGSSPPHTQAFVLGGSSVLVPAVLIYSTFAFWVFRGKVTSAGRGHK
ncbi:cytochrome d ubiquinol oxidase subunit II [Paraburkholderia sp. LEh10]|jgi:cytochrome d ubiquinol oxidase subunit II|uniref:cytochrome d ubiquinol oxidase subunit II n=1 Tax=Paraburkholderia sp. LEh10 TaxID=2821353 RepID=UPI001AE9A4C2|nr:cytochrome d ubiquinol oxidase subunit II [Paraburkholderia sp. LEh10]MBP0588282.1 cytochrome d ubiquinol oxidase subunit II [Paraburkholderia sp. LEh10]